MSGVTFAALGPLTALRDTARAALMDRATSRDAGIRDRTAAVVERVRRDGDVALREMAREFDGVTLTSLEVPRTLWRAALDGLDPDVRRVLERAAANIRTVHEAFRPVSSEVTTVDGVRIGRRPDPLGRVGVYAPGGRATYPSSLLMGAVPARVAGVGEVIVCSPPDASGRPSAVLMAAAAIAGVDRMFAIGGAGAVAAMAYGTETVPAVDRIVGPGNAYVAEAKLQVAGAVAIDAPAGPSELLVIADAFADPVVVATEMIAQAEHDPLASVVLVTWAPELATRVVLALERLVPLTPRADIVRASFAAKGGVVTVATRAEAIAFGSAYAAEHALIATRDARAVAAELRNAGTIFVGETASVAFGDYLSGANHVLPTGGMARSYSGLSTLDFYRWTTWQVIDQAAAGTLAADVGCFADAEGLPGHAAAARQWMRTS